LYNAVCEMMSVPYRLTWTFSFNLFYKGT